MTVPEISVLVLAPDPDAVPAALRTTLGSVRDQTMRAVEAVVVADLADGPEAAGGRHLLPLLPGETLEKNACRNLWETAERTGADMVVGRRTGPGRQPEPPWQHEVFGRSRVVASLEEVPELPAGGEPAGGWCARRELFEGEAFGDRVPGAVLAARAARIALVPHLAVRRPVRPAAPAADGAAATNRLTYCDHDPARTGRLVLAGRLADPFPDLPPGRPRRAALDLAGRRSGSRVRLPLTELRRDGTDLTWRADVRLPAALRPSGAGDRVWNLRLAVRAGADEALTEPSAVLQHFGELLLPARPRLSRLAGDTWRVCVTRQGGLALRLEARTPAVRRVRGVLRRVRPAAVRGALRGRLRSRKVKLRLYEALLCRLPMRRGSVVFESHMGKQYGDSPRAVYEEIRRRNLPLRCYWSHAASPDGFPADARLVRRWSWPYLTALARAEFWVDNQGFPPALHKPARTTYLQTWHGSAFKRMGSDEARVKMLNSAGRRRLQQAVDRFDHFLVRGEHDVRTLGRAYRLPETKLLRIGYPRNDQLVGGSARDAALAEQLGIPEGSQVVLYAPTFREGGGKEPRGPQPDVAGFAERFAERFGGEKMLLVRAHYLDRPAVPGAVEGTVIDVSARHDVTAVLGLADVLVTDYSSVMFDYALLDRPMVFYTPDLDAYTAERGSYFDLREHAPGPLTETEDDLFRVLAGLHDGKPGPDEYAAARRRFAAEFGGYDTGGAAAAVVDRFFGKGRGR